MRFGITAFCTEDSLSPASLAAHAEQEGFDVVLFPDHTHVPVLRATPFPGGGPLPDHYRRTYDPFVAAAFAAGATTQLRLAIGVCLVPAREPIGLAKQVASLDVLSGGRLLLGVGAGWNEEEVSNHGVGPADRWAVMRERVFAMKRIWTTSEAEFHGQHVSFDPLWSWPKPRQKPHPPILVGGWGPGVLERVIAYGDEWLAMVAPGQPPLRHRVEQLQAMATAAGRVRPTVAVQLYGDPPREDLVEHYITAGVDRIDLSLPYAAPDEASGSLERLGRLVRTYRGES